MWKFWFPVWLLVILIAGMAFLIWWAVISERGDDEGKAWGIAGIAVALLFLLIYWPVSYTYSLQTVAKMKAFDEKTKKSFKSAVRLTKDMETAAAKTLSDSGVAYVPVGRSVSERLSEYRDQIKWYNETLLAYQHWNRFWFSRGFIASVPSELIPIETLILAE